MSFAKKALLFSSVLALGAGVSASAADRLNGAGATFVPCEHLPKVVC